MWIAAAQMTSGPDTRANLDEVHRLLTQAKERGCDLVALPENFALMPMKAKDIGVFAKKDAPWVVETLQEWAASLDIWILAGGIALSKGGKKPTNSSLLIDDCGEIQARYDKFHLFNTALGSSDNHRESKMFSAGTKKAVVAKTPWAILGMTICFDLRFSEQFLAMRQKDATILTVPSSFLKVTGEAHWNSLLRARAIESQAFVVAPAQWGKHPNGLETYGHTSIIDPWGRIIAERPQGTGLSIAHLDFAKLAEIRRKIPMR